ncbi:MAG: hypothetical protein WAM79_02700 [Candidatus Sulfotelmatobacter sp.]
MPISTFDAGPHYDTRLVIFWLVVLCNESGLPKFGASTEFLGQEALLRPALFHMETHDTIGELPRVRQWRQPARFVPTQDHDKAIQQPVGTLKPVPFEGGTPATDEAGEQAFRGQKAAASADAITWTYKVNGNELTMTNPTGQSYTAKLDGTEAPYKGDPGTTSVSLKMLGGLARVWESHPLWPSRWMIGRQSPTSA